MAVGYRKLAHYLRVSRYRQNERCRWSRRIWPEKFHRDEIGPSIISVSSRLRCWIERVQSWQASGSPGVQCRGLSAQSSWSKIHRRWLRAATSNQSPQSLLTLKPFGKSRLFGALLDLSIIFYQIDDSAHYFNWVTSVYFNSIPPNSCLRWRKPRTLAWSW